MKRKGLATLVIWALGSSMPIHGELNDPPDPVTHDYLRVDGQRVISRHALPYSVKLAEGFVYRNELDYELEFNDIPFSVSVVIFESDHALALIWAETMPEGFGRLGYSRLEPDSIAGVHLRRTSRCRKARCRRAATSSSSSTT